MNADEMRTEFQDDYEHPDSTLEYLLENVLMPFDDSDTCKTLYDLYNSRFSVFCPCGTTMNSINSDETTATTSNIQFNCSQSTDCLHGGNYIQFANEHTTDRELILKDCRPAGDLIYECGDMCTCPPTKCFNRLVQYGPRKHLIIIDVPHLNKHQVGLATIKSIPKGGFVCEYVGELLTRHEAQKRYRENKEKTVPTMNYIICLNEWPSTSRRIELGMIKEDVSHVNDDDGSIVVAVATADDENDCTINEKTGNQHFQTFIDPSRKGNIGRYLNHSCEPNCEIFSVRIDGPLPRLGKYPILILVHKVKLSERC